MKIQFNFEVFKDEFCQKKLLNFCSFEDFERIVKWIKEKNSITFDKEKGLEFLRTDSEENLSKAFNSFYKQYQKQEIELTGKEDNNIHPISFNRKFVDELFLHAQKEIVKNIFEKYY